MEHSTTNTIEQMKKHFGPVFGYEVSYETVSADDHDGEDGIPVDAVRVDGLFEVYPRQGGRTRQSITGPVHVDVTEWQIDILVDASDPSVGMYASEPQRHSIHNHFSEMLRHLAMLLAAEQVERSLEHEADVAMYEEEIEAQKMADLYWSTR